MIVSSQGETGMPQSLENQDGSKVVRFEFVAMKSCLEAASSSLEHEASRLELEAHIAVDRLTSETSTINFERVRQIKTKLAETTGRVQKVRDELEHVIQISITEKLSQKLENSDTSSTLSAMSNRFDVEEVETLLKSYVADIDGTLNKVSRVSEFVDKADNNLTKKLDDEKKQLVELNTGLSMVTLVICIFIATAVMWS